MRRSHRTIPTTSWPIDWLNSRAAIARFERQTIEIRIIDLQECPAADLAIAELVVALVRAFYDEELADIATQQAMDTLNPGRLPVSGRRARQQGRDRARRLLELLGYRQADDSGADLAVVAGGDSRCQCGITRMLLKLIKRGTLAEGHPPWPTWVNRPNPDAIKHCYRKLAQCPPDNQPLFNPPYPWIWRISVLITAEHASNAVPGEWARCFPGNPMFPDPSCLGSRQQMNWPINGPVSCRHRC